MTPVTVLLALSIGMPSTVREASFPSTASVKPMPLPFVPVVSFEMVIWPAAPEVWLTRRQAGARAVRDHRGGDPQILIVDVSRQAAQRVGAVGAVHGDGHRRIRPT